MKDISEKWDQVEEKVRDAVAITWDGCHKIYIMMDQAEADKTAGYGYTLEKPSFEQIQKWFDEACDLKFISATATGKDDSIFIQLIEQFAECEDEDDEWY